MTRFLLVGNPENRRITLFQAALAARGEPAAEVVPWREVAREPERLLASSDEPRLVRLDATGEDWEAEKALLRLGADDAAAAGVEALTRAEVDALAYDRGRIVAPRQHHLGFVRALRGLEEVFAERPAWTLLDRPASVIELFDKRLTSRRWRDLGIPVPEPLDADPRRLDELVAALRERGWSSAFVKLSCGSSASGLGILRVDGDVTFMTTIEATPTARYNNLRVRRYDGAGRVAPIVDWLLREGAQIERAVPKARFDGAFFDLRVLVVAGEPAFVVVRQSAHPITNLHLGGRRGDLAALRAAVPPASWDAAMADCARVADAHGCFRVGVDLLFEPRLDRHRVIEGNAFGDLLPGLTRDGLDVYGWQIARAGDGRATESGQRSTEYHGGSDS